MLPICGRWSLLCKQKLLIARYHWWRCNNIGQKDTEMSWLSITGTPQQGSPFGFPSNPKSLKRDRDGRGEECIKVVLTRMDRWRTCPRSSCKSRGRAARCARPPPPPLAASAWRDAVAPRRRPLLKLLPSGRRLDVDRALGFRRRPDVSQKVQMIQWNWYNWNQNIYLCQAKSLKVTCQREGAL